MKNSKHGSGLGLGSGVSFVGARPGFARCAVLIALAGLSFGVRGAVGADDAKARAAEQNASSEDFAFARRLSRVFRAVAEKSEPSVVHITQLQQVRNVDFFGRAIGPSRIVPAGVGSGVIVDREGYILTNNHVIAGAKQLQVKLSDGSELEGRVIDADPTTDLAVIKIDADEVRGSFPAASFADSSTLEVGEWVIAIGSPFGLDNSVTQGIVSAKGRSISPQQTHITYEDYIQTDAAINPGNSGGPLLNLEGQVVGINSAIASRSGGYDGLGFAIPANVAKTVYENIREHGRLVRGYLGVEWDARGAKETDTSVTVSGVSEGSPAADAGIEAGDVITKLQGEPAAPSRFARLLRISGPGARVQMEVQRAGKTRTIEAKLGDFEAALGITRVPTLDIAVRTLTRQLAEQMGYNPKVQGVVVSSVGPRGRGADRLEVDDVVASINERATPDAETFGAVLDDAERDVGRDLRLGVIRNGQRGYVLIPAQAAR